MSKQLLLFFLSWFTGWLAARAQPVSYAKAVQEKIRQVEHHLAADIRLPHDKDWSLQERMQYYRVPGLSVAVVHNYQIEWAKAYGWADQDQHRALTTQTRFQAGLLSQALHGMGVLKLVQDKKIDLYADINTYLTTWKFPYDSVTKGKKISMVNLLSHTAGLPVIRSVGYPAGTPLPSLIQILDGQKPANTPAVRSRFEPSVRSLYSGGGLVISQQLLVDVTHQPYDQYMWERVLKPLGMVNSSYTQPPGKDSPLATGYDQANHELAGKYPLYPDQAAAGLWTTPTDLARYMVETQLAYSGKSSKVLTPETTRLQLTPFGNSSAALGVKRLTKGDNPYFTEMDGPSSAGFTVFFVGSLTDGYGAVIMVNSDTGFISGELANSIARVYQWPGYYQPTIRQTVAVPDTLLQSYVGDYQLGNTVFTITKVKDQLFEHVKGGSRAELFPETPTKFFFRSFDAEIEFIRDKSGKVVKRTMVYNGQKTEALRIH